MARPTNKERIRRLVHAGKHTDGAVPLHGVGRGWVVPLRVVREALGHGADTDLLDLIEAGSPYKLCVYDHELCLHIVDIREA